MFPGAVSSEKVIVRKMTETSLDEEDGEDSLTAVVRKQEAALRRLEEKHGAGDWPSRSLCFIVV